jgi:hypothetical protein
MPPRHYRTRTNKFLVKDVLQTNCQDNHVIEQYFLHAIESIALYSDMNMCINEIKSLITIISSKDEVYILLDKVETIIESIVKNIKENVSVGIILDRIAYVRGLLSTLPDNYTDIAVLILNILESVTTSFDFNTIRKNIMYIQELIPTEMNEYENIHSTILSILTNIEDGGSHFLINQRIEHLQTLIQTF